MRWGGQRARREFGAALGALAILVLTLLAPVHAIAQVRAATGSDLSHGDLVALTLCAGGEQTDQEPDPAQPQHKPICDSCLPGCRILAAPPLALAVPVEWIPPAVEAHLYPAERAAPPPSLWQRALPEVRGPPRG